MRAKTVVAWSAGAWSPGFRPIRPRRAGELALPETGAPLNLRHRSGSSLLDQLSAHSRTTLDGLHLALVQSRALAVLATADRGMARGAAALGVVIVTLG